jgi:hypothetical protein
MNGRPWRSLAGVLLCNGFLLGHVLRVYRVDSLLHVVVRSQQLVRGVLGEHFFAASANCGVGRPVV